MQFDPTSLIQVATSRQEQALTNDATQRDHLLYATLLGTLWIMISYMLTDKCRAFSVRLSL